MIGFDDHCQAVAIVSGMIIVVTSIIAYSVIILKGMG